MSSGAPIVLEDPGKWLSKQGGPQLSDPGAWLAAQGSGNNTQTEKPDTLGNAVAEYGRKINPLAMGQGMIDLVTHNPIDTAKGYGAQNQALADAAVRAFKSGNYVEAGRHALAYLMNGIPGMGTAIDEAGNKAQAGRIKESLADTAALATQIVGGKYLPGAAAEAVYNAPRLPAAVVAGVKAAAPDVASGLIKVGVGEATGAIPGMEGPARWGFTYPGVRQTMNGVGAGVRAARAALQPPIELPPAVSPLPPEPPPGFGVASGSTVGPIPEAQPYTPGYQPPVTGALPTQAPPAPVFDPNAPLSSGTTMAAPRASAPPVMPAYQPPITGALPNLSEPVPEPSAPVPQNVAPLPVGPAEAEAARVAQLDKAAEDSGLLDALAQDQAGMPFKKLDMGRQAIVLRLARQIAEGGDVAPPSAPAQAPAIAPAPARAAPVSSGDIAQQLRDEMVRSGTIEAPQPEAQPIAAYHGTNAPRFDEFDNSKFGTATDDGDLGAGHYFSTDKNIGRSNANLASADVSVKNPLKLELPDWKADKNALINARLGTNGLRGQALSDEIRARGYDGVILDYSPTGYQHSEIMVPDSAQARITGWQAGGKPPQNLAPVMRDLPPAMRKAAADANYRAVKEGAAEPETAGPTYEAAARGTKTENVAKALQDAGVTYDRLSQLTRPELESTIQAVAKELGVKKLSGLSLDELMERMRTAPKSAAKAAAK